VGVSASGVGWEAVGCTVSTSTPGTVGVGASGAGPGKEEAWQPVQAIKTVTINRHERNFMVDTPSSVRE
jgi:hypothetical protein